MTVTPEEREQMNLLCRRIQEENDPKTGQAVDLTALCSGGATLHLPDFKVNNANVNLSGGSQATINLDGRLDANLSGGARLFYVGNPTLGTINTSGGASISKAT